MSIFHKFARSVKDSRFFLIFDFSVGRNVDPPWSSGVKKCDSERNLVISLSEYDLYGPCNLRASAKRTEALEPRPQHGGDAALAEGVRALEHDRPHEQLLADAAGQLRLPSFRQQPQLIASTRLTLSLPS